MLRTRQGAVCLGTLGPRLPLSVHSADFIRAGWGEELHGGDMASMRNTITVHAVFTRL